MQANFEWEKLLHKDPKIKYGFTRYLLEMAKENPALLYPHLDRIVSLTDHPNNIIKWTAIDLIGYLSAVDKKHLIPPLIDRFFVFLHSGELIAVNHAIFSLGLMAKHFPKLLKEIIGELITIDNDLFKTTECKNISIGKVILVLRDLIPDIKDDKEVMHFIAVACKNSRNATCKKAESLYKKCMDQYRPE